jgi:hypothetical protein
MKRLPTLSCIALICGALCAPDACIAQMPASPVEAPQGRLIEQDARPQGIGVGVSFLLLSYSGDIDQNNTFPDGRTRWQPGAALLLQARAFTIGRSFCSVHFRLGGEYVPLRGTSSVYEFISQAVATNFLLHIEFARASHVRPFLEGGVGFLYFDTKVTVDPEWAPKWETHRSPSTNAFVFPMSVGLTWSVGPSIDIYYQFNKTLALSDNLDGWVANINDNYQTISIGAMFFL